MKSITVTTHAAGSAEIQDPFPSEGRLVVDVPASTTKTFAATTAQYNRLQAQLDAFLAAGIFSSVLVDELDEERSDELLELKNRIAKVVTLNNTTLSNPNLVTLGIRKGDICCLYVAATGITLYYTVDEVNAATIFTATGIVVAWNKVAAGDSVYFMRDGVEIATSRRTIPAIPGANHLIATVSEASYQRTGFGRIYFKAADGKPYAKTGAGVELSLGMTGSDPLLFKGAIAVNTDFPLIADVKNGWTYIVTAEVTDNAGVLYTNTGQAIHAGSEIVWNGTNWTIFGVDSFMARSHEDSRQLAAASETLRVFRPRGPGRIVACAAETGTAAAAGESMTFDVQIAGVTSLTGVITINNGVVIDTPVAGVMAAGAAVEFAAGELITVVRVYVPGGTPTPMHDTVVDIEVQLY